MQSILELIDESNLIWDRLLTDSEIEAIYYATTEEEKEMYMLKIQDYLENWNIQDWLQQAVSYLNLENFVLKNKNIS